MLTHIIILHTDLSNIIYILRRILQELLAHEEQVSKENFIKAYIKVSLKSGLW